jgi:hypothetical protein
MPEVTEALKPSILVEAIRAKLLDGLAEVDPFAEAIGKTPRTIYSYIALGMPTEYIGRTPYVVIEPAREWLRSRRRRFLEPRGRGRPKKGA